MMDFYFSIAAKSKNAADAIAEAHRLAAENQQRHISVSFDIVEVRVCDTKELVARVFSDGSVALNSDKGSSDELARGPWKLDASEILDASLSEFRGRVIHDDDAGGK